MTTVEGEIVYCLDPSVAAKSVLNDGLGLTPNHVYSSLSSATQTKIVRIALSAEALYNATNEAEYLVAGQLLIWQEVGVIINEYSSNLTPYINEIMLHNPKQTVTIEFYDTTGQDLFGFKEIIEPIIPVNNTAEVVKEADTDIDDDMISDSEDKCPNTKANIDDGSGCELDTDKDQIADYQEISGELNVNYNNEATNKNNSDTDGDSLYDMEEITIGTNPNSIDTDGDGLTDSKEINDGTDPLDKNVLGIILDDADSDSDGVVDSEDMCPELKPNIDDTTGCELDTDSDTIYDYQEISGELNVNYNNEATNEKNSDTDGDLLDDMEEITIGTNPNVMDSDSDGINDGEEVSNSTDPLDSNDPEAEIIPEDTDGDGIVDSEDMCPELKPNMDDTTGCELDTDSDTIYDYQEISGELNVDYNNEATDEINSDTDEDLLDDMEEITIGTNPNVIDTDHDGINDGEEVESNTDPLDENDPNEVVDTTDTDGDTIYDYQEISGELNVNYNNEATDETNSDTDSDLLDDMEEITIGTNPNVIDTDSDGISDGAEITNGTDPIDGSDIGEIIEDSDTDGDGVIDSEDICPDLKPNIDDGSGCELDTDGDLLDDMAEITAGTNPNVFDTDNDGLSDSEEINNSTDPLDSNDPPKEVDTTDSDGDGLTDSEEETLGTNSNDNDTDSDWIHDGREVNEINTDPLTPDTNDGGHINLVVDQAVYTYFNDASIYTSINYWTEGVAPSKDVTIKLKMRQSDHGETGNTSCNVYNRTCTVYVSETNTAGDVICKEKLCETTLVHEMGHVYQFMTTGTSWHNYQPAWSTPSNPTYSLECSDDLSDDLEEKKCHIMLASKNSSAMHDYYFLLDDSNSFTNTPCDPSSVIRKEQEDDGTTRFNKINN